MSGDTFTQDQLPTPPLTPENSMSMMKDHDQLSSSPDFIALPPPAKYSVPELDLDNLTPTQENYITLGSEPEKGEDEKYAWREGMTSDEKDERQRWLAGNRGRKGLRIVIVTENFLPKVDGVTRTLARLLEHLQKSGHDCILLGPQSTLSSYASHPLVGTLGIPLVVYPGLKLNFLRPKFLSVIKEFQPDVIHFVDPIWLGPQVILALELGWAGEEWVGLHGPALGGGLSAAVVASYHTNLATYATLFGLPSLTPIMWQFQRYIYSKLLLTLCPSPSTKNMLESKGFEGVRLWPRGVDLEIFSPMKRSRELRAEWGVGDCVKNELMVVRGTKSVAGICRQGSDDGAAGIHWKGRKASLPLSPPLSPYAGPVVPSLVVQSASQFLANLESSVDLPARVVLLYVGRISWEKNLSLLLSAYSHLTNIIPADTDTLPKMIFVGDGPARQALEEKCRSNNWDVQFLGHQSGEDLARCYASADIFTFPSFTETFGQVVLEALASGLPVIGLDAEGTRDLVSNSKTGLLLPLPTKPLASWAEICQHNSAEFDSLAVGYADLIARVVQDHSLRKEMGGRACSEGIEGYTWWDAMEKCVDGYRESIRISLSRKMARCYPTKTEIGDAMSPPSLKKISTVNRVVSRRLAHKGSWPASTPTATATGNQNQLKRSRRDTAENIWHLKTVLKAIIVIIVFWAIYKHHTKMMISRSTLTSCGQYD